MNRSPAQFSPPRRLLILSALLLLSALVAIAWVRWGIAQPMPIGEISYFVQLLMAVLLALIATATITYLLPTFANLIAPGQGPDRWSKWLVAGGMLIFSLVMGAFVIQRHEHFNSAGYDLGNHFQAIYNTAYGRWYSTSVAEHNYLGHHFKPLMAVLSPFVRLWPTPYWLLLFQTGALAAGAIPTYQLATRRFDNSLMGALFAFAYLLYPALAFLDRFDFHWEITVIPLFLATLYAVDKQKWGWATLWLVLAMFAKETIGLTVVAFGLWVAWRKNRKWGFLWAAMGLITSLSLIFLVIPAIRSAPSQYFGRYGWLGSSPAEILRNLFTSPVLVFNHLWDTFNLHFLLSLLGPVMFLPLFSSLSLVLLPAIGYNLLSAFDPQKTIFYQYVAPLVPFVIGSAIYGSENILRRLGATNVRLRWLLTCGLLAFSLWHFTAITNPLIDTPLVAPAWSRLENEEAVRAGLAQVPASGNVFTTNHYASHLAARHEIYNYLDFPDEQHIAKADILFFNLIDNRRLVAPVNCETYQRFIDLAIQHGFGVTFFQDDVVVLIKGEGDPKELPPLREQLCP